MYIVNECGILHSIPDDWELPTGTRKATGSEIGAFESSGEQVVAKMKMPKQPISTVQTLSTKPASDKRV